MIRTLENEKVNVLDVYYGVIFSPNDEFCHRGGGERPPILHKLRCLGLKRKKWGQPCLQIHTCAPELDAGRFLGSSALDKVQYARCFQDEDGKGCPTCGLSIFPKIHGVRSFDSSMWFRWRPACESRFAES